MSNITQVLFINIDGLGDYFYHNIEHGLKRIEKVKQIKKELENKNLRVILMNPLEDSDIKIPIFNLYTDSFLNEDEPLDYSIFILKYLYDYIKNENFSHVVIFQYDGYPINIEMWDESFLDYEYIGVIQNYSLKNINYDDSFSVINNKEGFHLNGGFSLRSKDFIKKCKDIPIENFIKLKKRKNCTNEDLIITDYFDINKMPSSQDFIFKFVSNEKNNKSFGYHKNE